MKRRASDDSDRITEAEVKQARIPWWKAIKLFLVNLPTIAKIIVLVIGVMGGTVAVPEAIKLVDQMVEDPLPIPEGQTVTPTPASNIADSAFRAQAAQSFEAMNNVINAHTASIEALRAEIRELESWLAAGRARGDNNLSERVSAIEEIVQP